MGVRGETEKRKEERTEREEVGRRKDSEAKKFWKGKKK